MEFKNVEKLKLVVVYNPYNKEEIKNVDIKLDYTLYIDLENFRKSYLIDILNRVRYYGEKIVVVINGKTPKTPHDVFDNIFCYTVTSMVKEIIEESDLAYYDGMVVRDLFNIHN